MNYLFNIFRSEKEWWEIITIKEYNDKHGSNKNMKTIPTSIGVDFIYKKKQYKKAMKWLCYAYNNMHDKHASYYIGILFYYGLGIKRNINLAKHWFEIDVDNISSIYMLQEINRNRSL